MTDIEHDNLDAAARAAARAEALVVILLLAVLALGAYFRLVGLDWDAGSHLHPDERFLTIVAGKISGVENPLDYLRTSRSTLNPYNFGESFYVYGNLPMTVVRYAAEWMAGVCDFAADVAGAPLAWCQRVYTGYDGIQLVGRALSALVDLVSILFTFLIGRRLYSAWAGLFAALLLAVAVMPIQQSHFFTMDNWATVFTTLALYAAVRAASLGDAEPRWRLRWWALFGLALGLAAASRINMAPLALVINVSAVIWVARRGAGVQGSGGAGESVARRSPLVVQPRDLERALIGIALAAIVSILT
ncbi:ArnT family glycosyltransferase, partial [Promineifilum sp.]|uniref:ArnT family glycosyltransferase n=1 Tax=Promineifilum sp. TaxID=2664178 RepID=UPI0035B05E20